MVQKCHCSFCCHLKRKLWSALKLSWHHDLISMTSKYVIVLILNFSPILCIKSAGEWTNELLFQFYALRPKYFCHVRCKSGLLIWSFMLQLADNASRNFIIVLFLFWLGQSLQNKCNSAIFSDALSRILSFKNDTTSLG